MNLTTLELFDLLHGSLRTPVGCSTDRKCDKYLVRVKTGVTVPEVVDLEILDRLDDRG